jgi:HD superfamily phosphohydrolase
MTKSDGRHHEAIGAIIVRNNEEIRRIIIDECSDEHAPDIVADIITGNVEREETDPLLVQIIHSEFDADGIDYLMRDATFSGTSFGSFEIDQLISCLTYGDFEGKRILCIEPKGIAAADQYLINKFFSYSQVVFNKHIVISEWMAECVVDWMQKHHAVFPEGRVLERWAKEGTDNYLNFTDNMFWSALDQILSDKLSDLVPHHIKVFCTYLLRHTELDFASEIRLITDSEDEAKELLRKSDIVVDEKLRAHRITIMSRKRMTNQTPIEEFRRLLATKIADHDEGKPVESIYSPTPEASRFMECLSVKDKDDIHLLCDDERSLMRKLYASTLVILRSYEFPI